MATIRKWLQQNKFNWKEGVILIQGYSPSQVHWTLRDPDSASFISKHSPLLDEEFYEGYGIAECPPFIAKDDKAIYFPGEYDGATFLIKVLLDIEEYANYKENRIPYPVV